ncbi:MAG TPA: type I methionyl aminopeptidase [Candidatus Acidoferrum sp.]|jgi:methionyl aminopeptidase|nr:type I methionyl aminopeptidase [Candidatus Acidoferrum sp.]
MIVCKSQAEIEKMHRAGLVIWEVLNDLRGMVRPGVTTKDLDEIAERKTTERKVRPAFKHYRGYPASLCTSVNSEVVHGIPSKARVLQEGDIISLDFGVECDGYYADAAVTVAVGEISPELQKLLQVTREALDLAIEKVRVGNRLSDISATVQEWAEKKNGYSVVRDLCGHGIGTHIHEEPNVLNYGEPGRGPRLQEGMVLAIEPMVNIGGPGVRVLDDDWTTVTTDGTKSAHFEHTVAVTSNGPWILTRPREMQGPSW